MYSREKILLASKHQKEKAIQPAFEKGFNATLCLATDYDTDLFGTFTGEIPRSGSPEEVLIKKAMNASEKYGFDYVISSEGSFGPHPSFYFCPADIELICFYDKKRNLKIVESEMTTETNFSHLDIEKQTDYQEFLEKVHFPSHALILRSLDTNQVIEKGITNPETLSQLISNAFSKNQKLRLETDMRAMHNPTRMKVIEKLAHKLVARIKNNCEKCDAPGFGLLTFEGNLPCEFCGLETDLYACKVENCLVCDYKKINSRTDGLSFSKQQHCSFCNP